MWWVITKRLLNLIIIALSLTESFRVILNKQVNESKKSIHQESRKQENFKLE